MGGWDILVVVVLAAPWVALAVGVSACLYMVWRAWRRRDRNAAARALLLAASPFLLYGFVTMSADGGAAARVAHVAALARTPMPADYPRTLEIYSHSVAARLAASVMVAGGQFDRVVWVDSYRYPAHAQAQVREIRFVRNAGCLKDAGIVRDIHLHGTRAPSGFHFDDINRCIIQDDPVALADTSFGDAVVLLTGHASPLRASGSRCDAADVRLRREGKEQLIDYWEDYCYQRVGFPLSVFAGLSDNTKHVRKVIIRPLRLLEKTLHPEETGLLE